MSVTFGNSNITAAGFTVSMDATGNAIAGCITSSSNGLWYSSNYGQTWSQSGNNTGIFLSVSMVNVSGTLYAIAGSASTTNTGLWYSSNNGQTLGKTWTRSNTTTGGFNSVSIVNVSGTLYAIAGSASSAGLWYSNNNNGQLLGQTWTQSTKGSENFNSVSMDASGNAIAGSGSGSGLWYSIDYGQQWSQSPGRTQGSYLSVSVINVNGNQYAIAGSTGGSNVNNVGLWYSSNNGQTLGQTWTRIIQTGGFNSVSMDKTGYAIAGSASSAGLWYSINYGLTWTQSTNTSGGSLITGNFNSVSMDGTGYAIAGSGSGNGLWYSSDYGKKWTQTTPTNASFKSVSTVNIGGTLYAIAGSSNNSGLLFNYQVPTVTTVSPNAGSVTGGTSVTIKGTNFTGATAVKFGTTAISASSFTVVSATSITTTSPQGSQGTVDVTVTTPGGISATSLNDEFTYYYEIPTVTNLSQNAGPVAGGTSVTITGTNFTGATAVIFGATSVSSFTVVNATSITTTSPVGSQGTVDVTVTTPGGISATSSNDQFTYYEIPTVTNLSQNAGPVAGGTSVTITGTNFTGATAVKFGTTAITLSSFTVVNATTITTTSPVGSQGTVDVTVTTPGGISATSLNDQFTYYAIPTVTNLSQNAGPVAGGTSVTITGTNFTGATAVKFGTTAITLSSFIVVNATTITTTSPQGSQGIVDVTVTTPGGISATSSNDQFTYYAIPTITAVSPNTSPVTGGTSVSITGTNFSGATAVKFGTTSVSSFTIVNATSITTTSPQGSQGTVDVTVTTPGGISATSSSDQFTYYEIPTVTNLSQNAGSVAGGTSVTITGTNFTGATAVKFGATPVSSFTVVSDTSITTTSPAGSSGVHVTVTNPAGSSATSSNDQFTYYEIPTVTSVSPTAGSVAGGTSVTITGTNFTGATAVKFGATPVSSFTVVSDTSITTTSPAGSSGVHVTVTNPAGSSATSSNDQFTYFVIPTVTSVSPTAGSVAGGTSVTITGTNFTGATAVKFGATPVSSFTVVSDTSITTTSPAGSSGVHVTVTNPAGSSATSSNDQFTYYEIPTVTSISPTSNYITGEKAIAITGTNFAANAAVYFGAIAATSVTVNSLNSITAISPPQSAGTVAVTVSTTGGTSDPSAESQITYIACFKDGSKILTDKGYKPIESLKKGDLVKTLLNGCKPIVLIGKREIYHPASNERIKNQLYQYECDDFGEPLVITGCHSVLVDRFSSEEQRQKVRDVLGTVYITDKKGRLPACVDERASVYLKEGTYTIYHIALEHENYFMNYGIYANGLLVESCSIRFLKELSNMELI